MLRLTLKNLAGNRIRFALTAFAVVLAVSFVVASFVLTDGLRGRFNGLSQEIVEDVDLAVRPVEDDFGNVTKLTPALLDQVAATDGVAAAAPALTGPENAIRPVTANGEMIPLNGPPQLAIGWIDEPALSVFTLVEGRAPTGPDEFTIDLDSAAAHGFEVGATYDIVVPSGTVSATLTGTTSFGSANDTLGAVLMQFPVDSLQEMAGEGGYDAIQISLADGADRARIGAELATLTAGTGSTNGIEVVDNATLTSEQQDSFNQGIDIIGNILLGFAGVSLFVSMFIIYNTFSIVLGQRTRELGLLRLVGAEPRQLRRSVLGEALVIGVVSSVVGIGVGVLLAMGLQGLFEVIGAPLPDIPETVTARTVVAAAVVGVGMTMASAIGPARKASRVPPVAALRDGASAGAASGRVRLAAGAVILVAGMAVVAAGLFVAEAAGTVAVSLALGAMLVFVGVTLVSPVVADPLTRALGLPLGVGAGVAGRLARQNAGRNPHRTATTAAALMIGLAAVTMALTVGESVKAQLRSTIDTSVRADYIITEDAFSGFSPALVESLQASPVVEAATGFRYDEARLDGEMADVAAVDIGALPALFDLDLVEGRLPSVTSTGTGTAEVLVSNEEAERLGLAPGDTVPAEFASGRGQILTVAGIFGHDVIVGAPYLLDVATADNLEMELNDTWVAFVLRPGAEPAATDRLVADIGTAFPQAAIESPGEFADRQAGFVDQALTAVNALVALAVVIALIGIANTLALSVFERTRELGLLRAVGMSRRQLRRMVRLEAALVALFGAALGVVTGLAFGWAAVVALPDSLTDTLSVPVGRIALLVAVAGVAGLLAAWGPARRASRLNVLDAIAT